MVGTGVTKGLIEVLTEEEQVIAGLASRLEAEDARGDHVRRAALGMELRDRVALCDATKQRLVHPLLRQVGQVELADRLDERARERQVLLARLDAMTANVSPRDIHIAEGADFDATLEELRRQVCADLDSDRREVLPTLRQQVSADELSGLGAKADKALARAPGHPRAQGPLAHERNPVTRGLHAVVDRVRNLPDAPHHSDSLE